MPLLRNRNAEAAWAPEKPPVFMRLLQTSPLVQTACCPSARPSPPKHELRGSNAVRGSNSAGGERATKNNGAGVVVTLSPPDPRNRVHSRRPTQNRPSGSAPRSGATAERQYQATIGIRFHSPHAGFFFAVAARRRRVAQKHRKDATPEFGSESSNEVR